VNDTHNIDCPQFSNRIFFWTFSNRIWTRLHSFKGNGEASVIYGRPRCRCPVSARLSRGERHVGRLVVRRGHFGPSMSAGRSGKGLAILSSIRGMSGASGGGAERGGRQFVKRRGQIKRIVRCGGDHVESTCSRRLVACCSCSHGHITPPHRPWLLSAVC
jgi:hypothetical protein